MYFIFMSISLVEVQLHFLPDPVFCFIKAIDNKLHTDHQKSGGTSRFPELVVQWSNACKCIFLAKNENVQTEVAWMDMWNGRAKSIGGEDCSCRQAEDLMEPCVCGHIFKNYFIV